MCALKKGLLLITLLAFAGTASAAPVYDIVGGSIRSILNLELNFDESSPQPDGLYDIFFVSGPGSVVYGEDPVFDVALAEDAVAALPQILDAINAAPEEVTRAGPGDTIDFYIPGLAFPLGTIDAVYGAAGGEYFEGVGWDQCDPVGITNCLAGITALNPDQVETYATFTRTGDLPPPPDPVDLTGTVEDVDSNPLCSLVLASGQFDYSCNPNGPYALLDLPRESDGTVKRQVYVDGFFPNVETLQGSTDETVVMTRAINCPDYNSFPDPGVFPGSAGKQINVSGTVLYQNTQTPVCALVLANGQFMFSCNDSGSYSLNIPLDSNGQYKLQVYADGFAPMVQAFDESSTNVTVRMASGVECENF